MRRLGLAFCVLGSAWLALWGCAVVIPGAPMSVIDPRPMGEGDELQLDLGATAGSWPYSGAIDCSVVEACEIVPSFGLSWAHHFGDRLSFGARANGSLGADLPAMGAWVRYFFADGPNFRAGVESGLGMFYVGAGLPLAFRLGGETWFFLDPSLELSAEPGIKLPLGLAIGLGPTWALQIQARADLYSLTGSGWSVPYGLAAGIGLNARF